MSTASEQINIDAGGGTFMDGLYQYHALAGGVANFATITDEHVARFHEQGYLVVEQAFSPPEVEGSLAGLLDLIDGKQPTFTNIQFEAKARAILPTLSPEQKQDAVRKLMGFVEYDARLKAIAEHPALLAVLHRLMNDVPVLFQDMALLKPPFIGREKPWHQDNAFFDIPPETTVVGVWIALDEAVPENGCMFIIPGSHREGPVLHWVRRDWQICDTDVAATEAIAVPLKPGGCLFFHGLLHHGTPPSQSARRRRALQYHYKPLHAGNTSPQQRLAVFGSEGKDVSC
jgi:phytanoyl-CoA hydroxylase